MLCIRRIFSIKHNFLRSYGDVTELYRQFNLNHAKIVQYACNSTDARPKIKQVRKNYRTPMDPNVEALEDKIIYCDHLHYDYVRMGHKQYATTKQAIDYVTKKSQKHDLMYKPVKCIALQYLNKEDITDLQEKTKESVVEQVTEVKPIHMPYARIDQVESVESNEQAAHDHSFDDSSLLNERYRLLYEKYLEQKTLLKNQGKDVTFLEFLSQLKENVEANDTLEEDTWLTDYEEFNDAEYNFLKTPEGTPLPNSAITSIPCGGCGALLHCRDPDLPGYLPSEILANKKDIILKNLVCKRCHFLKIYNTALEVNVLPEEYPKLLRVIKRKKCAVIVMVDLMDFPCSIWHDLKSVLHPLTVLFVVGNKVDLLPQDQPRFLTHVQDSLLKAVLRTGIKEEMVKYVALVSAKTGYGIEELINKIQKKWGCKGDIYVIGCTNVGKSSLFNTLLKSDMCKSQAVDAVQRATTSPWPGTTLNLLKFPLLNPQRWRLHMRATRLASQTQARHSKRMDNIKAFKASENIRFATLTGDVGMTFESDETVRSFAESSSRRNNYTLGLDESDPVYALSRWCYDTPGTMQPDQILNLLTTEELLFVLPQYIIMPRTFIFYAKQTVFLAGLGRLDFLEGDGYMRCTIFASDKLPLTMCYTEDADELYQKLLQTKAFAVPINDPKRLQQWPALESQEIELTSDFDHNRSCADIVLSSAGWIAITPADSNPVKLRAWTPQGRGLYVRTPPLLPYSVKYRGCRIDGTPLYTKGRQIYAKG